MRRDPRFGTVRLRYAWRDKHEHDRMRTAVSLHGHTLHSREGLDFIPTVCQARPLLKRLLGVFNRNYRSRHGKDIDFSRAWWTPPVCAMQALDLERRQIEECMGAAALVSLTDHDTVEAANRLSLTASADPIRSIEWTVPFGLSFLHLGVHNLPLRDVDAKVAAMNEYTNAPDEHRLGGLLEWIAADPATLIVFNHPLWDEKGIGDAAHRGHVARLLSAWRTSIHALELNGLRSWAENAHVLEMAAALRLPCVSGGDRHGTEPNAILNLTNAASFAEFAGEVRVDGLSDIVFMPHYRQARALRLLHNLCDIVGEHHAHSLGHRLWTDRVFYRCDAGATRSLSQLWDGRTPAVFTSLIALVQCARRDPLHFALKAAFAAEEVA